MYTWTGSIYKLFASLRFFCQPKDKIEADFADVLTEFLNLNGSFNIDSKPLPEGNAFFFFVRGGANTPLPPIQQYHFLCHLCLDNWQNS